MKMMAMIVDIMFSGCACNHIGKLRELVVAHHALILQLYGLALASKPKIHYLYHCVDDLEQFGVSLSCFAPERFHKLANSKARHSSGDRLSTTVINRLLTDLLLAVEEDTFAMESYLLNSCSPAPVIMHSHPDFHIDEIALSMV